ncbi:allergen Tha p 1-like [Pieris napi]|uniref:allergen Tha p 1-like n=1 Tax=Pieris napi TaxID=78633 RepID=UPI001FB97519|nr:allergen Tha p 1-like [Pieris napi]
MKIILLLAVVGAAASADTIDFFSTADDNLDMEAVINDPAKLKAMTDCFLDKGPCDPVAQSYKLIIPQAFPHACGRCNDAQKHLAHTYLRGLLSKIPEDYDGFLKKYDPQGIYLDNFMEAVKDY